MGVRKQRSEKKGGEDVRVKTIYVSDRDEEFWKKLQEQAEEERRSVSFVVNILVRDYIRKGRHDDHKEGGTQE